LGFEHAITCESSVGLEYNYAGYGSIGIPDTIIGTVVGAPIATNFRSHNSVKVNTSSTMLKYSYYFSF
jgi:hypothetical protein